MAKAEPEISSLREGNGARLKSDDVLRRLAPGLLTIGFEVEVTKTRAGTIRRPVLFGENGQGLVSYDVDGFHESEGIVLEVEASRGARGNATFRDIVRTSLILDAEFLALLVPMRYRYGAKNIVVQPYRDARELLSAIYASQRLRLPFQGVLLCGY